MENDFYKLEEYGPELQEVIDDVQRLVEEGGEGATLLTAAEKEKLSKLGIEYGTTASWEAKPDYVPGQGIIVIYSDYQSYEKNGETVVLPGIKIGNGVNALPALPFLGENLVVGSSVSNIVALTETEYEQLPQKSDTTLYVITSDQNK